jgi:hypothetical protein
VGLTAVDAWQELLAAALLGTGRRPLGAAAAAAGGGGELSALLAALAEAEPPGAGDPPGPGSPPTPGRRDDEGVLLSAAAVVALHRRAGRRPAVDPGPPPDPCPPDETLPCGPGAAGHLALVLHGGHGQLLPEWLGALAGAGRRLPEEHLPGLLGLAGERPELRVAVEPVLGWRGRWLAAQNPAWSWALDTDPEAAWRSGGRAERLALLDALRAAGPGAARALVEATWDEEGAELRAAMVERFGLGLGMADEPFLEAALDDRAGGVRRAAAALLARLPGSRLCARMAARALPLLRLDPGPPPRLEATLPETLDTAMARDGVTPRHHSRSGQRAGWLLQLVEAVPPVAWCERLGARPADLVRIAGRDGWSDLGDATTLGAALVEAWAVAAGRQRDPEWAGVLLTDAPLPGLVTEELLEALPPERREALALHLLGGGQVGWRSGLEAATVLGHCPAPWSQRLGRAVLAHLGRLAAGPGPSRWGPPRALDDMARRMPVRLAGEAAAVLAGARQGATRSWASALDRFLDVLAFRRDLHKELAR